MAHKLVSVLASRQSRDYDPPFMPVASRRRLVARVTLAIGVVLFLIALRFTDWHLILASGRRLVAASAMAIALSGGWPPARNIARAWGFERPRRLSFARLFRVELLLKLSAT